MKEFMFEVLEKVCLRPDLAQPVDCTCGCGYALTKEMIDLTKQPLVVKSVELSQGHPVYELQSEINPLNDSFRWCESWLTTPNPTPQRILRWMFDSFELLAHLTMPACISSFNKTRPECSVCQEMPACSKFGMMKTRLAQLDKLIDLKPEDIQKGTIVSSDTLSEKVAATLRAQKAAK
jgi:hypothetical protein